MASEPQTPKVPAEVVEALARARYDRQARANQGNLLCANRWDLDLWEGYREIARQEAAEDLRWALPLLAEDPDLIERLSRFVVGGTEQGKREEAGRMLRSLFAVSVEGDPPS